MPRAVRTKAQIAADEKAQKDEAQRRTDEYAAILQKLADLDEQAGEKDKKRQNVIHQPPSMKSGIENSE